MSLPTPYYEEQGITIYHGDCREILPTLEPVDLVLTDPPYGIFKKQDNGMMFGKRGMQAIHPTQKPIALMHWCLSLADNPQTILDPFMGSGTTLRAAKDLGRKAIGIEINEQYCEIAVNRLRQEVLLLTKGHE